MSVAKETEAEIRRLHYAEHWKVGTISNQLGIHPDVVRRVLGLLEPRSRSSLRPRLVDPYIGFINETLATYPTLPATRLYDMLQERGYEGSVRTLRDHVKLVRPQPKNTAYLRTEPLCAEQAQVDWAHVAKVTVAGGERVLWLFVMVLSYSRALWAEFVHDMTVYSLCRSLVRAVEYFGGCPRQFLFDNPKTVVLERYGDIVRFHPTLLEVCGQLRVQPRLCGVGKPNHKARVERAIRYLRDRFLPARQIDSIEQGNRELLAFLRDIADQRPHPRQPQTTVGGVMEQERGRLLPLPDPLPATDLGKPVRADKTAFVRFDCNEYSVPPTFARQTLTLLADDQTVRLLDGGSLVARHPRCWGRRQVIEATEHREELIAQRRRARDLKGRDRLRTAVPRIQTLLERWMDDGYHLGTHVARACKLLELYAPETVIAAVDELIEREIHDPSALLVACDRRHREQTHSLIVPVALPDHVHDRDVVAHDLEGYDEQT